ncbi:MAG: hypothetical protein HYY62_04890 [Deltaproteobacteria bacterium]|nr:hypothetical protein [Deltaproteobacteria bacterium]
MKEKIKKFLFPLLPLWKLWMKLGHVLGTINAFIILTLLYLLILTPIGLLRRLFGKNDLKTGSPLENSFWIPKKSKEPTLSNYTRQF